MNPWRLLSRELAGVVRSLRYDVGSRRAEDDIARRLRGRDTRRRRRTAGLLVTGVLLVSGTAAYFAVSGGLSALQPPGPVREEAPLPAPSVLPSGWPEGPPAVTTAAPVLTATAPAVTGAGQTGGGQPARVVRPAPGPPWFAPPPPTPTPAPVPTCACTPPPPPDPTPAESTPSEPMPSPSAKKRRSRKARLRKGGSPRDDWPADS